MDELFSYRLDALTEKERFIRFLSDNDVLRFGEFPFRNGRISPYYISTERFSSGSQLTKIGEFYAACIRRNNIQPDLLLANTHKESHIVTAVGMTLYTKYGMDIPYCIRNTIGKASFSAQSITLLKDTMTSGNTLRAVMADIQDAIGKYPTHVVLSVDRLERGFRSQMTTANEIRQEFGVSVCAIVTVDDIICALENHVIPGVEYLDAMKSYRDTYRGI